MFPTEFGRRDWIRTNDPHHVKVVIRTNKVAPALDFSAHSPGL